MDREGLLGYWEIDGIRLSFLVGREFPSSAIRVKQDVPVLEPSEIFVVGCGVGGWIVFGGVKGTVGVVKEFSWYGFLLAVCVPPDSFEEYRSL